MNQAIDQAPASAQEPDVVGAEPSGPDAGGEQHRFPHTKGYQRERMKSKRGKGKGMLVGGVLLAAVGVGVLVLASLQQLSEGVGTVTDVLSFTLITGGVLLGIIGLVRGG